MRKRKERKLIKQKSMRALEHAKKKGKKTDKAEEYAVRTAIDKLSKKYLKDPGPEHGPGKSGPLTVKKKAKLSVRAAPEYNPSGRGPFQPLSSKELKEMGESKGGKWQDWFEKGLDPNVTRMEEEVVTVPSAPNRPYRSKMVGSIQELLIHAGLSVGSKSGGPDYSFGPTTAKSWNRLMDMAGISEKSAPRISPRKARVGEHPSGRTMRYVLQYGDEILSRAKKRSVKQRAPKGIVPLEPKELPGILAPVPRRGLEPAPLRPKELPGVLAPVPARGLKSAPLKSKELPGVLAPLKPRDIKEQGLAPLKRRPKSSKELAYLMPPEHIPEHLVKRR
jgi:hypothetical protein